MAQWRITRGEEQFVAANMEELKAWADGGKIRPDDVVLHPQLGRHMYAVELDEIGPTLAKQGHLLEDDEFEVKKRGVSPKVYNAAVGFTILMFLAVLAGMTWAYMNRPDPDATTIYDPKQPGIHGSLKAQEALVTANARLHAESSADSPEVAELPEGRKVVLKAKTFNDWYKVETADGQEGYIPIVDVVPGYFFDPKKRQELDPIFNPDRYIKLLNYAWEPSPERGAKKDDTIFTFTVENTSRYPMDSVVLLITMLDDKDEIVEERRVSIEDSVVPARDVLYSEPIPFEVNWKEVPNARARVIEARAFLDTDKKPDEGTEAPEE